MHNQVKSSNNSRISRILRRLNPMSKTNLGLISGIQIKISLAILRSSLRVVVVIKFLRLLVSLWEEALW